MQNIKLVLMFVATCALAGCDRSSSTANTNDNKSTAQPVKSAPPAAAPKPATTPAAPAQPPASTAPAQPPASTPPAAKPATDAKQPVTPPQQPAPNPHGPPTDLGTTEIGGYQVKVVQNGSVVPGRAADFDVFVVGGQGKPTAIRLWIGTEDGTAARKIKVNVDKANAHNHVPAGNPIPEGAKLCVEVELPTGEKKVGTLAFKS